MYPIYSDIRERLGEPLWHDARGVPRYAPFAPDLLGVYDRWACLFVVRCQDCGRRFDVAGGCRGYRMTGADLEVEMIETPEKALEVLVHWGDAPWHDDGGCAGSTMRADVVMIRELWGMVHLDWERVSLSADLANRVLDGEPEEATVSGEQ